MNSNTTPRRPSFNWTHVWRDRGGNLPFSLVLGTSSPRASFVTWSRAAAWLCPEASGHQGSLLGRFEGTLGDLVDGGCGCTREPSGEAAADQRRRPEPGSPTPLSRAPFGGSPGAGSGRRLAGDHRRAPRDQGARPGRGSQGAPSARPAREPPAAWNAITAGPRPRGGAGRRAGRGGRATARAFPRGAPGPRGGLSQRPRGALRRRDGGAGQGGGRGAAGAARLPRGADS